MSQSNDRNESVPPDDARQRSGCLHFDARLGALIAGELADADCAEMMQHASTCATCGPLLRSVEEIITAASALPPRFPSRDLWPDIEQRLEAPVIAMDSGTLAAPRPRTFARMVSMRQFAAAAALLVTASSAVTWRVMRSSGAGTSVSVADALVHQPSVPSVNALTAADTIPAATTQSIPAALTVAPDVDAVYEEQISGLRQLVDARFAELDSATVAVLRRNLAIIDEAISDSRRALRRSPTNALVSSQLDRALQSKLALMRRVVLL